MNPQLPDVLLKLADVLHWLGRYTECNACILLARLLRAYKIDDLETLESFVDREEANMSLGDAIDRGDAPTSTEADRG